MRHSHHLKSLIPGFGIGLLMVLTFICGNARANAPSVPAVQAASSTLFTAVIPINDPATGAEDFFGSSVALSADGNTALVGSPGASVGSASLAGAAYIFSRSGGNWSATPVATFTEPGPQSNNEFGFSVALSADGNTALVGTCCTTQGGHTGAGAAYVFTRSGGNWTMTPAANLAEPATGADHHFGVSVALAGTTVLVGAPDTNGSTGAAYVFAQSGANWPLAATFNGSASGGGFGTAVALAADSSTALVGAPKAGSMVGAAYIFTASGGIWTTTPAASLPDPGTGNDGFGSSVAIDGGVAFVGAPFTKQVGNAAAGAAYFYTVSAGVWPTTPGNTLTEAVQGAGDQFGVSGALSADGNTAFIGARNGSNASRSYLYGKSGGIWGASPGATFNEPDPLADANFSSSLALSSDGSTAVLGAPNLIYAISDSATDLLGLAMSSSPGTVNVGQTLTYTFTVTNDSASPATGVTLTDTLPADVSFSSATAAGGVCNDSNGTVTCTLPSLAAAGQWTPTITVNAVAAGSASNSAAISATETDPFTANNTASTTNTIAGATKGGTSGGKGGGALDGLTLIVLGLFGWRRKTLHH